MTHQMKLRPEPFAAVRDGYKSIELRLYDDKRRTINVGDEIVFSCTDGSSASVTKKVIALHVFNDFHELYNELQLLKCGYTPLNLLFAKAEDMEAFYPIEEQRANKVVGIEFEEIPLQRFIAGHNGSLPECSGYETALAEIRNGLKETHWIWYIFPMIKGLTADRATEYYALDGIAEAKAFYEHPILGSRLREITSAVLALETDDIVTVFETIDAYKLRSCMTLFSRLYPDDELFEKVLEKYCMGMCDEMTIELMK